MTVDADTLYAVLTGGGKEPATLAGPTDYVSHDYGTPPEFVEIAHAVFDGPPSLDPFSSPKWNDALVKARRIITADDDGFKTPWFPICGNGGECECDRPWGHTGACGDRLHDLGRLERLEDDESVIVNPPGNRTGSNVKAAWVLLETHHRTGDCAGGGLWIGFNLNQLQTLQHAKRSPLHPDFLRCIPRKRSAYLEAPGVLTTAPRAPSWLLLMPATAPRRAAAQRAIFTDLASKLGAVF